MSTLSKYKIFLIVLIIAMMEINYDHARSKSTIRSDLERELSVTRSELETFKEDRDLYKTSLQYIVSRLYEKESYIGFGGYNISGDETIETLFSAIMNSTTDYQTVLNDVWNYFDRRTTILSKIPSIWPLEYDDTLRITSGFGWRMYPLTGTLAFHKGIDLASSMDARVLSTAEAVVLYTSQDHPVYGKVVTLRHPTGYLTVYGHLSKVFVSYGDRISRGEEIGIGPAGLD